ncbi:MAG: hypothetical protein ACI9YO_000420 [Gammaproteobacteria bacterium]|jgi:hypothetical protein
MESIELEDFNQTLPNKMPIAVIMEKTPSDSPWIDFTYQAIGVISSKGSSNAEVELIHENNGVERYLVSGLGLQMHVDECESYYHNLMSPQPGCYIVAGEVDDPNEMPIPYLVSLSFDEVHAYLEGDEYVYAVEIPPELYQWSEAFILQHYVAVKKTKRKLKDWKGEAKGQGVDAKKRPIQH